MQFGKVVLLILYSSISLSFSLSVDYRQKYLSWHFRYQQGIR